MKKLLNVLTGVILLIAACGKNDPAPPEPEAPPAMFSDKIELKQPKIEGDAVKLSWSILDNSNFYSYIILRKDTPDGLLATVGEMVMDSRTTTILDEQVPYSPEVVYQIVGQVRNGAPIYSNTVSHKTAGVNLLNISPYDVIYNGTQQLLYFFEQNGRISMYDLKTEKIIKQIETKATTGYADMESFNGKTELYVPRNDGWIFVYDALTLEKITQITVGTESTSVVSQNNILYVSTSSSSWPRGPLKVYRRADRALITETGDYERTRLRKVPGSNTRLVEVTMFIGPTNQYFYEFTKEGSAIQLFTDRYHGDYPLDASIFAFFPNGSKYITASQGAIYNINLTYDKSLPRGNLEYSDFCFDDAGQSIYAATTGKSIEVYSTSEYSHLKSIRTKAYPYKIFKTPQGILSVSTMIKHSGQFSSYYPTHNKVLIEKLNP
ncbi:YncE family protein [Sphingobacterium bambusae]|uniref:YncE family protein n=1 Tax=Sphingobacterium bambusae TaxID=662858 RepID=A0ABW6BBR4_9SPHI|nr:hypothetical protein [Sphingobacterium bambusae]WPL47080.1 hypothetical protein SCB77_14015 [Sphingobacterium bambusae]